MNDSRWIYLLVGGLFGGLVIYLSKTFYFVGLVLSFIVIAGQNYLNIQKIGRPGPSVRSSFNAFAIGLFGYLLSGLIEMLFL